MLTHFRLKLGFQSNECIFKGFFFLLSCCPRFWIDDPPVTIIVIRQLRFKSFLRLYLNEKINSPKAIIER